MRIYKMDSKKIKDVLRHHSELTQQIHKQVLEIREKLDEVQQQTIEMASYPKIDLSQEGGGRGTHKDLADVYLRYQKLVNEQEEQLAAEKRNLLIEKETQGLEELEVELIKNSIPKDADAQTIKAKVEAYKNMQAKKGLKGYVSAGDGDKKAGELPADFKSAMSNFVSSKTKK